MVPRVCGTKTATSASTILRGGHQTDQVDAVSSSPYLCLEAARCVAGVAYREAIVAGWPTSDARDLADNVFAACKDVGPGRMDEPLARARALLATTSDSYATQPKTGRHGSVGAGHVCTAAGRCVIANFVIAAVSVR